MLKIKNVKAIRYRGYALYSTSKTTCVTCKINKDKYIAFSSIESAKLCVDLLINGCSEIGYSMWDLDRMLRVFKDDND